jgi:hypothetical protein
MDILMELTTVAKDLGLCNKALFENRNTLSNVSKCLVIMLRLLLFTDKYYKNRCPKSSIKFVSVTRSTVAQLMFPKRTHVGSMFNAVCWTCQYITVCHPMQKNIREGLNTWESTFE